jgi:hypothetical protein
MAIDASLIAGLALPGFARVDEYGPRRVTQVGRHDWHGGREVVIDRRRGPGWGSVAAAGLIGAAAGLVAGAAIGPPVVAEPPVVGTVVPVLPGGCVTVPSYGGGVVYNCGNIFYQPFYEGASLMYQIVPAP